MKEIKSIANGDDHMPAGEGTSLISDQLKPDLAQAADQQKVALQIAAKFFPENTFQVIGTEPEFSGGFHFHLKAQKQDNGVSKLKPAFKQPWETERAIQALDTFTVSFDPDQQKVNVLFENLGTLKSFSYKELGYGQGDKQTKDLTQMTAFSYKGFHIERLYPPKGKGTYRVTGKDGWQLGEKPYDQVVPYNRKYKSHKASDDRLMPQFKTDAEIRKEVDDILLRQEALLDNQPQHLFTVDKKSGEISLIGKDQDGKPVLKEPAAFNKPGRNDPPLLEIIPHKGFLGNFILNFKNNYKPGDLEILAVPGSMPLEAALQEIKENLPGIRAGAKDALAELKARTGISGLTDQAEREFISLPEEQQQKLLHKLEADLEGNNAYVLAREHGRLLMPDNIASRTTFLQDLSNFIALLKDEELKYPGAEQPTGPNYRSATPIPTKDMQQPKFDPDKINWKDAEKLGLTRELLEKTDNMQRLLNGEKTTLLQGLKGDLGGVKVSIDGKFRLVEDPNGQPTFVFHGVRSKLDIPRDYLGYPFTEEDKKNLAETGSLQKQVLLTDKATGQQFQAYLGVDKDTNELVAIRAERIKIPDVIKGVTLNENQKKLLREGKPAIITGMRNEQNQEFSAAVHIDPARKGFAFRSVPAAAISQAAKPAQDLQPAAREPEKKTEQANDQQQKEQEPGKKRGGPKI